MEKLELKHLTPYLPYGLKVYCRSSNKKIQDLSFDKLSDYKIEHMNKWEHKLILRPLSDLTKEIKHNGKRFVPIDYLQNNYPCFGFDYNNEEGFVLNTDVVNYKYLPYMILYKLFEWHFDVFNLRENDLCIYYNEL